MDHLVKYDPKNIKTEALRVLQQFLKSYFGTIEESQLEKPDGFRIDYIIVLEFFKNSIAICFSDKIPVKNEKNRGIRGSEGTFFGIFFFVISYIYNLW